MNQKNKEEINFHLSLIFLIVKKFKCVKKINFKKIIFLNKMI